MPTRHSNSRYNDPPSPPPPPEEEEDDDAIPVIRVIAPKTLQEGYEFDVLVKGKPFTVRVPKGGVKEGQEFDVLYERRSPYDEEEKELQQQEAFRRGPIDTMPSSDVESQQDKQEDDNDNDEDDEPAIWYDESTGAPIGGWRNSLCSWCDVLTQSTFWMGLCCTPILIAQLITRLRLTWNGQPTTNPEEASLSFNRIVLSMMIVLAVWKVPLLGGMVLFGFWMLMVTYVGSSVRNYMRHKYKVPPTLPTQCGHRIDDGCCMLFCGCCSAIQMARHTHDDKEFPGHGCTTTGLGVDAPKIV